MNTVINMLMLSIDLRNMVLKTMTKKSESIIQGAKEALAFVEGDGSECRVHIPDEIDVKRIRTKLRMSQKRFAETYGISLRTVQEWEQGRMMPSGPARIFLIVLDKEPEAVSRALSGTGSK